MNRQRVGGIALVLVGVFFLGLAFSRTPSRAVWIAIGGILVILGARRLRRAAPPTGTPGA